MNNKKKVTKISTGIIGLDELFYGGLRYPDPDGKKGICIAIYGNRGISKMDIALQIMYGITSGDHSNCRYFDINRSSEDVLLRYNGLHIGRLINKIRHHEPNNNTNRDSKNKVTCNLCDYFNLRETGKLKKQNDSIPSSGAEGSGEKTIIHYAVTPDKKGSKWSGEAFIGCSKEPERVACDLCKLIRHEVVNYNDRTRRLHWTVSDGSDNDNVFAEEKEGATLFSGVFQHTPLSCMTAIQKFNVIRQEIKDLSEPRKDAIVIGGFTALGEELSRMSFDALINELRKKARVSILVFDERGANLHLNTDILIEMRVREDEYTHYLHHELRVAKSDLQRHVYGWHHYKKLRDLSIEVYPNVHALMSHRFSSTYALSRIMRDSLKHPQTLLQKFQDRVDFYEKTDPDSIQKEDKSNFENMVRVIRTLKESKGQVQSRSHLSIIYERDFFIDKLCEEAKDKNTILLILFGKDEISISSSIRGNLKNMTFDSINNETINSDNNSPKTPLEMIHCWSVRPSDILPEEILGVIKQYVRHWWNNTTKKSILHIYLDDIDQFWLYPLLAKERNFLPALFSICNEVRYERKFDKPLVIHDVKLHLVCSDEKCLQYKYVEQLIKWNN